MKIEIDLNDLLGDEHGPAETLGESIRRQIVAELAASARKDVKQQISAAVNQVLDEELRAAVKEQMPSIVQNILDTPYTPVGTYGDRGKETTFRAELLKAIQAQMVYKKTTYDSDRSAFTAAVDEVVRQETAKFQKEWHTQVTSQFMADAMKFATAEMAKRLRPSAATPLQPWPAPLTRPCFETVLRRLRCENCFVVKPFGILPCSHVKHMKLLTPCSLAAMSFSAAPFQPPNFLPPQHERPHQ